MKVIWAEINTTAKVLENTALVPNFIRDSFKDFRSALPHLSLLAPAEVDEVWFCFKKQLLTQQHNFITYCERRLSIIKAIHGLILKLKVHNS